MDSQRWNQIERVYEAARKLPPADRETFLAKACENDADLAGEVAHLLESTDALLFSVEDSGVATATYVEDSVLPPDLKLGPYQIIGPLGEGGMGKVYRARDTRLDRPVAIKVSSQRFSRRFEQEARSISALNIRISARFTMWGRFLPEPDFWLRNWLRARRCGIG